MKLFWKNRSEPAVRNNPMWRDMYEGGGGSLNLAAAISSELARLVTLEMKSRIYGSERAEFINGAYQDVIKNAYNFCETACAIGGVVLKPYINGDRIMTAYLPQDAVKITAVGADGSIRGAEFYESLERNGVVYKKCEEHTLTPEGIIIKNSVYKDGGRKTPIQLSDVSEWADIEPEVRIEGVSEPLFSYFRMPFINTADMESPLGAPVFSRADKLIGDAQRQYERILWEFESGERALYLDETAVRRNIRGEIQLPDKRLYRLLNTGNDELFCDWTPEIRDEALINGFERILQRIEFNCGLAYGTLSDPQTVDKTAEEIRSSKQRSYATVTQIQRALKEALCGWACAANMLCGIYALAPEGKYKLDIMFDDSIIADRATEFSERMELLKEGVISRDEMRSWYLGENEGGSI